MDAQAAARAIWLAAGAPPIESLALHRTPSLESQPRPTRRELEPEPQTRPIRRELNSEPQTYMERMRENISQCRAQEAALMRAANGRLLAVRFDQTCRNLRAFCDVCFKSLGVADYLSMSTIPHPYVGLY